MLLSCLGVDVHVHVLVGCQPVQDGRLRLGLEVVGPQLVEDRWLLVELEVVGPQLVQDRWQYAAVRARYRCR